MSANPPAEWNWAGNLRYSAPIHTPESEDQLRTLVAKSRRLRVVGARHSFNGIADCDETLVSLQRLPRVLEIDSRRAQALVDGAATYADVCPRLCAAGFALPNLASLPHLTIAGACATATHGSGSSNRTLASSVAGMDLVTADGSEVTLSREAAPGLFEGAVVHLGALGVVTRLTLDLIPGFRVRQTVYEGVPLETAAEKFEEITSRGYSVSLFTDWQGPCVNQVWIKTRETGESGDAGEDSCFGARPASAPLHPLASMDPACCTTQMGQPGPWHERLPHFRADQVPSAGSELQSEYFLDRRDVPAAFEALRRLAPLLKPLLLISEVRTVDADSFWLSPCFERQTAALHFTWRRDWAALRTLLPQVEAALAPFAPRPHWGKLFTLGGRHVRYSYRRLPEFQRLARELDPSGKFVNAFLRSLLFPESEPADAAGTFRPQNQPDRM